MHYCRIHYNLSSPHDDENQRIIDICNELGRSKTNNQSMIIAECHKSQTKGKHKKYQQITNVDSWCSVNNVSNTEYHAKLYEAGTKITICGKNTPLFKSNKFFLKEQKFSLKYLVINSNFVGYRNRRELPLWMINDFKHIQVLSLGCMDIPNTLFISE